MNTPQYTILEPAYFRLDGGAMYGIIPKPLWNKVHPADNLNRVDLALRLMLIEQSDKKIVIDTGIGDYHDEKFNQRFDVRCHKSPLEETLDDAGVHPEEITDLIVTHLHFDHVGGIGKLENESFVPLFKNARVHLHKDHYEYAHNPTPRDSGSFHTQNFDPIIEFYKDKNKIVWHEGETGEILKLSNHHPLRFICSHGHTPHLMHPYNDQFIYLADLIPTAHHVHIPRVMGYDIAPGVTTENKEEFLNFINDKNLTVIFEHDPENWGSRIKKDGKKFKVSDILPKEKKQAYRVSP